VDGILEVCEKNGYQTVSENLRIYTKFSNQPDCPEYLEKLSAVISQLLATRLKESSLLLPIPDEL